MRAVVLTKHGDPGVLQVQEKPAPTLAGGQVRIEVAACGVNFADVMARVGFYPDAPKPPCVLGYEVSGTVTEIGEPGAGAGEARDGEPGAGAGDAGNGGLNLGQRVMAATMFGGYASEVVVPMADVLAMPEGLSFEQAAAIPVNYATAWAGLIGYGNLQPGERILIHAAGGGVGIAATQLARRIGAEVYGTASPAKHERIRELGVQHPLDYDQLASTNGRTQPGFDLIMDALGGRSLRRSYELLRPGGRLVAFGVSGAISGERRSLVAGLRTVLGTPRFNLIKQMSISKAVIGLNMLSLWKDRETLAPWTAPLRELLDDGTIQPVVAGAFGFEEAGEAHRMLVQRRNLGKVVLTP